MKKILVIFTILVLFGTMSASALPITIDKPEKTPITRETGNFEGEIGHKREGEWNAVGEISGTYQTRNRYIRFRGQWEITEGQHAGTTGTIVGFSQRNFIIGRITIDETGRTAPIVGFIRINGETKVFGGRFMSIIGPALYFKGTYR
jgi:hypothetical protein